MTVTRSINGIQIENASDLNKYTISNSVLDYIIACLKEQNDFDKVKTY